MMMEIQLHMKKKKEDKAIKSNCNVMKVKLPKLVIITFNGTHIDWFKFWNQFKSKIDRSELPAVSKCSYFKELISPKVSVIIDGLPFTNKGYTRAKNILISKYRKPTNAHIQNIMSLPHINSVNFYKEHEFTEKN